MEEHENQYLALSTSDIATAIEACLPDQYYVANPDTTNDVLMRNAFQNVFGALSPVRRDFFITANDFFIAGFRCSQVMDIFTHNHDTYGLIEGQVQPPVEIYNQVVSVVLNVNPSVSSELESRLIEGFELVLSRLSVNDYTDVVTNDCCAFLSGYVVVNQLYNCITDQ
jgi:hypothetical protein